jgi:hypothetical protein
MKGLAVTLTVLFLGVQTKIIHGCLDYLGYSKFYSVSLTCGTELELHFFLLQHHQNATSLLIMN